ncbi:hypothetical protein IT882_13100 [Microbacterium schleiferi]|uniref:Uncharacterized protein n=1 Tax=Microbacterium schleiferi TaxID=69362 RepID=A0A7S8MWU6_9MICO|nr:hypothetical protein [Microbacterium schleiferi]QPE04128.1 hypothetical protein IT882_13100 [Microbacterium schleiferi]
MPINATEPFASVEDMEKRSQGEISAATHPYLASELLAATNDIRSFCRWHISPVLEKDYVRFGGFADDVWLPAMEITGITEVVIDGEAWTPEQIEDEVEFDPATGWTNLYGRAVRVKYTAGFAEVPQSVKSATLELAAAALGTALGQTREQAGAVSIQFEGAGGGIDPESTRGRRLIEYRIGRLP